MGPEYQFVRVPSSHSILTSAFSVEQVGKPGGEIVEKRVKNELLKNENKRIGYWITEKKRNWKNALLTSLACSISSGSKEPSKYESATSGEYGDPVQYCSYSTISCFFLFSQ